MAQKGENFEAKQHTHAHAKCTTNVLKNYKIFRVADIMFKNNEIKVPNYYY